MKIEQLIHALDLCTNTYLEGFCPCDHCPMMEAGCDEAEFEYVTIPRQLLNEIYKQLDPNKTEFTHIRYVN